MRPSQLRLHAIGSDAQLSEQKTCKEVSPAYDWLEHAAMSRSPKTQPAFTVYSIAVCGPKRPRQEMRRQIATYKKMRQIMQGSPSKPVTEEKLVFQTEHASQ